MIDLNTEKIEELKISGNVASFDNEDLSSYVGEVIKECNIHEDDIELYLKQNGYYADLGASSGFVTKNLSTTKQLSKNYLAKLGIQHL